jgi:5,10-methylenetetrahydromethanopterin reductase
VTDTGSQKSAMRIGLSLAEPPPGPDAFNHLRRQITEAAADGFTSGWMAHIFGLDALTALAVAGRDVPGFELGTAVVPTYPRHPAALAQQALTAQGALDGRLALGIGLSHQVVIEGMFGYSFDKPARHMRDYLDILLPLLRDGNVSHTGETNSAHIGLTSPREHPVPVYLAAMAPRMLHLAGAVADGTILWMTGPATVESHVVPKLTAAAEEAGRPAPRVVCILPVCVTNDPDAARERANKVFAVYNQLPSYRAMLDIEGAGGPGDVAIVGDEGVVREQIGSLADIGVTDFVAGSFGAGDDAVTTRALLSAIARGEA